MKERLQPIAARIDRLFGRPDEVRSLLGRVSRLLPRRLRPRPRINTARLEALLALVGGSDGAIGSADGRRVLRSAVSELEGNVARVERAAVMHGRAPDGYVRWLWRLYQVVHRAVEWWDDPVLAPALGEVLAEEAPRVLGPLAMGRAGRRGRRRRSGAGGVDALLDAALAETRSLARQRRLLEAARQLLMETAAALDLEPAAIRAHQTFISRRLARLDRLQAAGVLPDVDLGYQLREALDRGDGARLYAVLAALEGNAAHGGDGTLARLAAGGLDLLGKGGWQRNAARTRERSLAESQRQLFRPAVREAVKRGYARADAELAELRARLATDLSLQDVTCRAAERYLTEAPVPATLAAAAAVDGCFDVGWAPSPVRAVAQAELRRRLVRHPTQDLVLEPAAAVEDLAQAQVGDPRTLLLDLATGKLLARRYVTLAPATGLARVVEREVRVYLLDGSTSMIGNGARMRDAILLAELATLVERWGDPHRTVDPVLYYGYFSETLGALRKVATPEEALAAIPEVVGTIRTGGTDIQEALLASFAQIREAVEADPDLAAAQVVLVTDGEAPVDAAVLERARAEAGRMPIGVSIVALGVENPALRQLAARQRERGERVFYQFVDDQELASIVSGVSAGLPVHLPPGASGVELSGEVRRVVGEIAQHLRGIDAAEIARAAELPAGLGEVGLSPETALDLGSRARLAALENDRVTLEHSFLRLFPHPDGSEAAGAAGAAAPRPPARRHRAAALADVLTALATVTEVVDLVGASALERQADAVEILERLLRDTGVAPWEYAALVQQPPPALREALRAVHGASRFRIPGGGPTSGLAATAVTGSSSTS